MFIYLAEKKPQLTCKGLLQLSAQNFSNSLTSSSPTLHADLSSLRTRTEFAQSTFSQNHVRQTAAASSLIKRAGAWCAYEQCVVQAQRMHHTISTSGRASFCRGRHRVLSTPTTLTSSPGLHLSTTVDPRTHRRIVRRKKQHPSLMGKLCWVWHEGNQVMKHLFHEYVAREPNWLCWTHIK